MLRTKLDPVAVDTYDAADLRAMATRYHGDAGAEAYVEAMREPLAKGLGIKVTIRPAAWLSADYDS